MNTNIETKMNVVPTESTSTATSIEATSTATIIDDTPATTIIESSGSKKFQIGLNLPTAIIGGSAAVLGVGGIVALHKHNQKKGKTSAKADADAAKLQGLLGKISGKGKKSETTAPQQPITVSPEQIATEEYDYFPKVTDATKEEYKKLANDLSAGKTWKDIMTEYKKSGRHDFLGADLFGTDDHRLPMAFDGMLIAACNMFTAYGMSLTGNTTAGVCVTYVERKPTSVQMHF